MSKGRFTLPLPLALLALQLIASGSIWAKTPKAIIAYVFVEDGKINPVAVPVEKLTHVNYAFADIRSGLAVEGFKNDAENFRALLGLKKRNPGLKVLVSIGGWTWSGGFSNMALTRKGRAAFIDSAVALMRRHGLDGIDIDWEFPGLPGYGNPHRPEDKRNFTLLMRELRQRLNREGRKQKRRFLSSCAVGAFPDFLANTEMGEVAKAVDMVNLMAYDFYEAETDPTSGHHAPLFTSPADPKKLSAAWAVGAYLKAGVPAQKLVLGVPFYGRAWTDLAPDNHGLYQPGKEAHLGGSFKGIAERHLNKNGFVRYWDDAASAPFLWNEASRTFITYEDPESLAAKCRYIRKNRLGGIMFWELSGDDGQLLEAIHKNLR